MYGKRVRAKEWVGDWYTSKDGHRLVLQKYGVVDEIRFCHNISHPVPTMGMWWVKFGALCSIYVFKATHIHSYIFLLQVGHHAQEDYGEAVGDFVRKLARKS